MTGERTPDGWRQNPMIQRFLAAAPGLKQTFGIRRIGIFGSYARGEQTGDSDVDILVEFGEGAATFDNFMNLADFLEDLLKKKVDLLTVAGIGKYIRSRVESEVIWIEG
jgi:uncharacterized protein